MYTHPAYTSTVRFEYCYMSTWCIHPAHILLDINTAVLLKHRIIHGFTLDLI